MRPKDQWVEEQQAEQDEHAGCTGPQTACPECLAAFVADMQAIQREENDREQAS